MGGFRVNGCGVTDHFKKIKSLGLHMCPVCKTTSEFFLEEAKQKVDVLFIPTVTLKSRYAVMCSSCKQGQFCSGQWAVNLINGRVPASGIFESEAQKPSSPPVVEPEKPLTPPCCISRETVRQPESGSGRGIPEFFRCAHCGVTQMREGDFCAYCGKPAPENPQTCNPSGQALDTPPAPVICLACGASQPAGNKFCSSCGRPLSRQQPSKVCPDCGTEVMDGMAFCMECGRKL